MSNGTPLRIRRSIAELQDEYTKGNKKPLEDLMRAWKGIKELPPDDPRSFFKLGGYHGEPFRGAGWGNASYWGGYCNHGNVLFPTWHRVYLLKLEDALRSIPGCADVTLPFWDETSDDSLKSGIPSALTQETFELDGQTIPNPLRSFVFTVIPTHVQKKYQDCLNAPNYTVFSNTTSAAQWNENLASGAELVVPIESPHNSIHLSVGGCDVPNYDRSPIEGANGDMGENDTAGLDPIFFFHHCFVDRVFWLWQKKHGCEDKLEIIEQYPGTNSVDNQGPTPGVAPNSWLTLASPLDPFKKPDGGKERAFTSLDCINIEKQLGYTYGPGSLEGQVAALAAAAPAPGHSTKVVRVAGINRSAIRGSFLISAFATIDGKKLHLGTEAVLSRWHVSGCANCQTHLEAKAFIGLQGLSQAVADNAQYDVEVRTRDGLLSQPRAVAAALTPRRPFHFEVR